MKNILTLIDFTEVTENVIAHAEMCSKAFGAKCWIIHIVTPEPEIVGLEVGPQYIRDDRTIVLKQEHTELQKLKKKLIKSGVDCEALLIQGYIGEIIDEEIKKLTIDMVIIGNNRHGKLYEVVVGSVGREVLNRSKVPVVVVS